MFFSGSQQTLNMELTKLGQDSGLKNNRGQTTVLDSYSKGGTTSHRADGGLELMPIETVTQEHSTTGVTPAATWRVLAVNVPSGYRLSITCNDGTSGIVDMSRLVASEKAGVYAALKDETLFNKVSIDLGVLAWPNGADLEPEWAHEEMAKYKSWSVPD